MRSNTWPLLALLLLVLAGARYRSTARGLRRRWPARGRKWWSAASSTSAATTIRANSAPFAIVALTKSNKTRTLWFDGSHVRWHKGRPGGAQASAQGTGKRRAVAKGGPALWRAGHRCGAAGRWPGL